MWGSFGDIAFKLLKTPESLQIEEKVKFATISVFGKKDKLHFTGFETRKVIFSFLLSSSFCNPKEELAKLTDMKNKVKAASLIIGDDNYGEFVIEQLKTEILKTTHTGQIITAKVEVTLRETGGGLEW